MIIKMNNKDEKFYQYMGKFFGSRLVEKQVNDRIYDDDKKEWYLYIEGDALVAFVSVQGKVIKNVYCYKEKYLEDILNYIKKQQKIDTSVLTRKYIEVYKKCKFKVVDNEMYKNFVIIYEE